ncbi:signal peptidase II [Lachnospiraceae bacterium ZAX-1]
MNMSKVKHDTIRIIGIICLIVFDQFTKYCAVQKLKGNAPFVVIDNVFELNYLENRGAAFGFLEGKKYILIIFGLVIVFLISYFYTKIPGGKKFHYMRTVIIFMIAGAIGNLIDRFRLDYVIDFFYFKLINFAIFNVADIYITCSAVILALLVFFYYKEEDFEQLFPEKGKKRG